MRLPQPYYLFRANGWTRLESLLATWLLSRGAQIRLEKAHGYDRTR